MKDWHNKLEELLQYDAYKEGIKDALKAALSLGYVKEDQLRDVVVKALTTDIEESEEKKDDQAEH